MTYADLVTEEQSAGDIVIRLHGDVDLDSHLEVERTIVEAVESGVERVVVDLSDVPFLDSSGVRALLKARQEAVRSRCELTVRAPQPIVAQVLQLTRVAPLLGLPPA
jgi:anti-sigma B factor antagonist